MFKFFPCAGLEPLMYSNNIIHSVPWQRVAHDQCLMHHGQQ